MMYHNDDIYNRLNGSTEAATEPEFAGPTFKMLLVGDGNVGKSAFVNRTLTGGFVPHAYEATMGGVIDGCDFHTNFGTVRFEICDIAGQDKRSGFRDGHYEGAECAIIMFDVTSPRSYESVARWRSEIERVCGAALPIVVCGNKVDAHDEASRSWLRAHEARRGGYSSAEDSSAEFGLPAGTVTTFSQEEIHQQMMQMMQMMPPDKLEEWFHVMMQMVPPQKLEELGEDELDEDAFTKKMMQMVPPEKLEKLHEQMMQGGGQAIQCRHGIFRLPTLWDPPPAERTTLFQTGGVERVRPAGVGLHRVVPVHVRHHGAGDEIWPFLADGFANKNRCGPL